MEYSSLGSASYYVPLREYINAAINEQIKSLIREQVLSKENLSISGDLSSFPYAWKRILDELSPLKIIYSLKSPEMAEFIEDVLNVSDLVVDDSFNQLPELKIKKSYILHPAVAEELKLLGSYRFAWLWLKRLEEEFDGFDKNKSTDEGSKLKSDQFEESFKKKWGLNYHANGLDKVGDKGVNFQEWFGRYTWTERRKKQSKDPNQQVIPRLLYETLETTVDTIASQPHGIMEAQRFLEALYAEVEKKRSDAEKKVLQYPENFYEIEQSLNAWQSEFIKTLKNYPHPESVAVRQLLFSSLCFYLFNELILASFSNQFFELPLISQSAVWIAFAALTLLPSALIHVVNKARLAIIKKRRIDIGLKRISLIANKKINDNLYLVYKLFSHDLQLIKSAVDDTILNLVNISKPQDPPKIPAISEPSHIKQLIQDEDKKIWGLVKQKIAEMKVEGQSMSQAFQTKWIEKVKTRLDGLLMGNLLGKKSGLF